MPGEQDLANTLDAIISEQEHWGHVAGQGLPSRREYGTADVTSNIDPNRDLNQS
jgi:hypothetical protein